MRGMLHKILREVWLPTLLFGLGLFTIKALLTHVLPQVMQSLGQVFEHFPLAKTLLTTLLGSDVGNEITARTMQAFLWVHPVVLALIWGHEIRSGRGCRRERLTAARWTYCSAGRCRGARSTSAKPSSGSPRGFC